MLKLRVGHGNIKPIENHNHLRGAHMSSETLSYFLKNEDIKLKARFQVALQCAPFLKGLKISSVITMEQKMCEELSEIFRGDRGRISNPVLQGRQMSCFLFSTE